MATATYTVEVQWPFTVGATLIGSAVFGVDRFAPNDLTTDVSASVKSFRTRRGRDSNLSSFQAGEAAVVLHDPNGDFNPLNTDSPYYPVLPGRGISMRGSYAGEDYSLFTGYVRSIEHNPAPGVKETRLLCQDAFLYLDRVRPAITATGTTTTGAAIATVLDAVGLSAPRNLDTGDTIPAFGPFQRTDTALNIIQGLLEAERGEFFQAADGTLNYFDRYHRYRYGGSKATLTGISTNFIPATDMTNVRNRVSVGITSTALQTAEDADSIATYGPSDYSAITTPYLRDASHAAGIAAWIIRGTKDPTPPVRSLDYIANASPELMINALSREISETITVDESALGSDDFFIEGIEHEVTEGGTKHAVSFTLTKASTAGPVTFGVTRFADNDLIVYG